MTVTNTPRPKVKTSIIFCLGGNFKPVRTGIGKARIARFVMMLTGAEHMNCVSRGMHFAPAMLLKEAAIGRHWKIFIRVRTAPARLTIARTNHDAWYRIFSVFLDILK